jgi:hypothetical protein
MPRSCNLRPWREFSSLIILRHQTSQWAGFTDVSRMFLASLPAGNRCPRDWMRPDNLCRLSRVGQLMRQIAGRDRRLGTAWKRQETGRAKNGQSGENFSGLMIWAMVTRRRKGGLARSAATCLSPFSPGGAGRSGKETGTSKTRSQSPFPRPPPSRTPFQGLRVPPARIETDSPTGSSSGVSRSGAVVGWEWDGPAWTVWPPARAREVNAGARAGPGPRGRRRSGRWRRPRWRAPACRRPRGSRGGSTSRARSRTLAPAPSS